MYIIKPKRRKDGLWHMVVTTTEPASGPFSVCSHTVDVGKGRNKRLELVQCAGHSNATEARVCLHAKAWAERIDVHGEKEIQKLISAETISPKGEDAVKEIEAVQPDASDDA